MVMHFFLRKISWKTRFPYANCPQSSFVWGRKHNGVILCFLCCIYDNLFVKKSVQTTFRAFQCTDFLRSRNVKSALEAVDDKLKWCAERLKSCENTEEVLKLYETIDRGIGILKHFTGTWYTSLTSCWRCINSFLSGRSSWWFSVCLQCYIYVFVLLNFCAFPKKFANVKWFFKKWN